LKWNNVPGATGIARENEDVNQYNLHLETLIAPCLRADFFHCPGFFRPSLLPAHRSGSKHLNPNQHQHDCMIAFVSSIQMQHQAPLLLQNRLSQYGRQVCITTLPGFGYYLLHHHKYLTLAANPLNIEQDRLNETNSCCTDNGSNRFDMPDSWQYRKLPSQDTPSLRKGMKTASPT
jgi:hypothetical protein